MNPQLQALLNSDSTFQQMIREWPRHAPSKMGFDPQNAEMIKRVREYVQQLAQSHGIALDQGEVIGQDGQVHDRSWLDKWGPVLGAVLVGGPVGATLAAGAGGAAGAGTAAGTAGAEGSIAGATPFTLPGLSTAGVAGPVGMEGGAGAASILGRVAGYAKNLSPILSNASAGRANTQALNDQQSLQNARFQAEEPAIRLRNAVRGSQVANWEPVKAHWGGPGSGLRGETASFSGGYANPNSIDATAREVGRNVEQEARNRPILPQPGRSNWLDKLLGGAATGTSILGAIRPGGR